MRDATYSALLKGFVTVELIGGNVGTLINTAQAAGIAVWDVAWQKNGHAVCSLYVRDFRRFRKVARQAGVKFHIIKKRGLPFILARVQKRKFFVLGLFLFFVVLMTMSNIVWTVDVRGNATIPEKEVLRLAREAGVYRGQFQFRLPDNDVIQYELMRQLGDASWVGMRMQGTRAIITVVEKRRIDEEDEADDGSGPYDLVARKPAVIADLSGVKSGRIVVEYNDTVTKGDTLVSGIYGSEEEAAEEIAGARGIVLGETWYKTAVSVPLVQTRKTYTGERYASRSPFIGHWSLTLPFRGKVPFSRYETIDHAHTLHFYKWQLPFGLVRREYLETEKRHARRTPAEAEALAVKLAEQDVRSKLGQHGEIVANKVLQKEEKDGKVMINILFTVRENIAEQKPISLEKSEDDT